MLFLICDTILHNFTDTFELVMCRSNCSTPGPPSPGTPGEITFFWLPGLLITLLLTSPAYNNTINTLFSSAPLFVITHIFPLTPGAAPESGGGDGGIGEEKFDRP